MQGHWIWKSNEKFDKRSAWISLLLKANHKDENVLIGSTVVEVKSGSFITSEIKLAEEWKWNRKTVSAFLKLLQNNKMIRKKGTTKWTSITIEKWDLYQIQEQQIGQQDGQQSNNKLDTNKNDKNIKNYIYGQNEPDQEKWEQQFEQFYKQYPKKVKKQDVRKWFQKNKPSNELFSSMMNSLEQFKGSEDWLKEKGQYIPYPTSWLNQKRWEDEKPTKIKNNISSQVIIKGNSFIIK